MNPFSKEQMLEIASHIKIDHKRYEIIYCDGCKKLVHIDLGKDNYIECVSCDTFACKDCEKVLFSKWCKYLDTINRDKVNDMIELSYEDPMCVVCNES